MSRTLHTDIEIQATADQVWEVSPTSPPTATGTRSSSRPPVRPGPASAFGCGWPAGGRETTFRPEVLEADPPQAALARPAADPGLFDGEHSFRIEPDRPRPIRLTQHEEFRGLLAPLLLARIGEPTRQGFHQMNQALKARSSSRPPPAR